MCLGANLSHAIALVSDTTLAPCRVWIPSFWKEFGERKEIGVGTIRQATDCVKLFHEELYGHLMVRKALLAGHYAMVALPRTGYSKSWG